MTGPGPAGNSTMGKNNNNNKTTQNLTPEEIEKIKQSLNNKQKEKTIIKPKDNTVKTENINYDAKKVLENNVPGEKFLIIHRTDENKTMRDFSPILLETVIRNATNNGKTESKFLKSGDILIKTENVKQAQQLVKLIGIMGTSVEVKEHRTMNSSKGVIRAYELQNEERETLLTYLKSQNVTDVQFHTKTINGTLIKTGIVFITFGTREIPEYLTVGLLRVRVRPYIPKPMRCFTCHKFGHLSKYCSLKETPTCYNCNNVKHIHNREEKCTKESFCVNCKQAGHNSYNRNCTEYKRQVDILTIKVTQQVSMAEAVKRSNINRETYAQIASQSQDICKCQHCTYHKQKTTPTININNSKRSRTPKTNSLELTTDEEETKKIKISSTDIEIEENWQDDDMSTE